MLVIGESINGTIEKVGQAILDRDEAFLRKLVRTQHECGARCLERQCGCGWGK